MVACFVFLKLLLPNDLVPSHDETAFRTVVYIVTFSRKNNKVVSLSLPEEEALVITREHVIVQRQILARELLIVVMKETILWK